MLLPAVSHGCAPLLPSGPSAAGSPHAQLMERRNADSALRKADSALWENASTAFLGNG